MIIQIIVDEWKKVWRKRVEILWVTSGKGDRNETLIFRVGMKMGLRKDGDEKGWKMKWLAVEIKKEGEKDTVQENWGRAKKYINSPHCP